jgi:vitamin B12 transporter
MILVVFFLGKVVAASAQSQEEMQIMSLYFPKKDLVVSATRHLQPVSKTAENITVITGDEIRNMNAHTVADVLYRIPGLFISYYKEMGAPSLIYSQGSEERHVLVLLDGIEWNFLGSGSAETSAIPVGIIDRIEVIQGPASSAWGSALGGVVNIITKSAGSKAAPTGEVGGAIGESGTFDYNGQVSGKAGPLGYYLYAGGQRTDGLEKARSYNNKSFYAKARLPLSALGGLTLSAGYSSPDSNQGNLETYGIKGRTELASWHTEAALAGDLTDRLEYKVSGYYLRQSSDQINTSLGTTGYDTPGDPYEFTTSTEKTLGGSAKLVWKGDSQVVVLGGDYSRGKMDETFKFGPLLQAFGSPATLMAQPDLEKWAFFLNDAISVHRLTITPGVRFDHNSLTGSFVSPSVGMTYNLADKTILRATVARGFTYPPLSTLSAGGLFLDPNPDLEPEKVWSYQAGLETVLVPNFWVRLDLFYHHQENALQPVPGGGGPPLYNDIIVNGGSVDRRGAELSARTRPFHHLSLLAGGSYVDLDPQNSSGANQLFSVILGVEYDNPELFYAQLFGRYESWDLPDYYDSNDNAMIWELNFHRKLFRYHQVESQVFLTVHNLFSGSQYVIADYPNPSRWIEAGLRCFF